MVKTNFNEGKFRQSVKKALKSVAQILKVQRQPQLAEDIDHTYDDKYAMVDMLSNVAIIAQINALAGGLGLTAELLEQFAKESSSSSITLRFQASESVEFKKKEHVRIGSGADSEVEVTEFSSSGSSRSLLSRVMKRAKEYHWSVTTEWEISMYSGTNVEERKILQSRSATRKIVTQSPGPSFSKPKIHPPIETSLNFLMQNIEEEGTTAAFQIDRNASKTPRRNEQVETMLAGMDAMTLWTGGVTRHFEMNIFRRFLSQHNPVHKKAGDSEETAKFRDIVLNVGTGVFCPIQPLLEEYKERSFVDVTTTILKDEETPSRKMALALPKRDKEPEGEDSPVLSSEDYFLFLEQQLGSLEEKYEAQIQSFPKTKNANNKFLSRKEVEVALHCRHSAELSVAYRRVVEYVEQMLRNQLVSAIGKEVDQSDIDKFVKYNNSKLLATSPQPFCHVVRRPEHSPEGILCIEGSSSGTKEGFEPIETFVRESDCTSIKVPLDAAASLELKGLVKLHGWLRHPFLGTNESYQLTARARQFSCFVLMIGTMASGSEFQPKDALIVRNKDEVFIPLLLKDIPSPKEFKDAIRSLSPEQQRFAKAFRGMQLGSSVFGVCVVQIKPQLENLLGLPADALTKEMKLTEDLIELFIEYQVPSDLLSFDGSPDEDPTTKAMVENVKGHVGSVLRVIDKTKNEQLGDEVKNRIARDAMASPDHDWYADNLQRSGFLEGGVSMQREVERGLAHGTPSFFASFGGLTTSSSCEPHMAPAPDFCLAQMACDDECFDAASEYESEEEEEEEEEVSCDLLADGVAEANQTPADVAEHPSTPGKNAEKEDEGSTGLGSAVASRGMTNVDFTTIPKRLNETFGRLDKTGSLRSCTVRADTESWRRKRQENLLAKPVDHTRLDSDDLKLETNRALDLLDALSRSGTLPIEASELHVVVAASHRFQNDVMGTVIEDDVNPIEKLEKSTLTFISSVHGEAPGSLVRDPIRLRKLASNFPDLLAAEETTPAPTISESTSGADDELIPARPDGWHELV